MDTEVVAIADSQAEHMADAITDADVVEDVAEDVERLRKQHKTNSADRLPHFSVEERAHSMHRTL